MLKFIVAFVILIVAVMSDHVVLFTLSMLFMFVAIIIIYIYHYPFLSRDLLSDHVHCTRTRRRGTNPCAFVYYEGKTNKLATANSACAPRTTISQCATQASARSWSCLLVCSRHASWRKTSKTLPSCHATVQLWTLPREFSSLCAENHGSKGVLSKAGFKSISGRGSGCTDDAANAPVLD